jgi:hypothetical protein
MIGDFPENAAALVEDHQSRSNTDSTTPAMDGYAWRIRLAAGWRWKFSRPVAAEFTADQDVTGNIGLQLLDASSSQPNRAIHQKMIGRSGTRRIRVVDASFQPF